MLRCYFPKALVVTPGKMPVSATSLLDETELMTGVLGVHGIKNGEWNESFF